MHEVSGKSSVWGSNFGNSRVTGSHSYAQLPQNSPVYSCVFLMVSLLSLGSHPVIWDAGNLSEIVSMSSTIKRWTVQ